MLFCQARARNESPVTTQPIQMDLGNVPTAQRSRRDHQPSSQVVQINPPQPKGTEIHTAVPMSFRESTTPIVKDQAQQYET